MCAALQKYFDAPGDALDRPVITTIDSTHPTLRHVDFAQATILRSRPLVLPKPDDQWLYATPLASFDQPLLITGEQRAAPRRRVAALGLDLAASDLPLRVAFPLLVNQTVRWLAGGAGDLPLSIRAGEDGWMKAGFHEIERDGRRAWMAVNLFDEAESDLRGAGGAKLAQPPVMLAALTGWPLWQQLALAAFALLLIEWWLFHRRRTE